MLNNAKLTLPRVADGFNFKKATIVHPAKENIIKRVHVRLDRYPKVDILRSKNVDTSYTANINCGILKAEHLELIDWTGVFFAMQKMKAERGWHNMELCIDDMQRLMADASWYELAIPADDLLFTDYGKIQLFKYLQTDVATQLDNDNLVLNSFIVSNTPMQQVKFWAKKHFAAEEFTANHVLFDDDADYLDRMMDMVPCLK